MERGYRKKNIYLLALHYLLPERDGSSKVRERRWMEREVSQRYILELPAAAVLAFAEGPCTGVAEVAHGPSLEGLPR